MRRAGSVLLDVAPDRSLAVQIRSWIESGDVRISDLHIWRIGPGHHAAIVALVTHEPRDAASYREVLADVPGLSHVTVEVQSCRVS